MPEFDRQFQTEQFQRGYFRLVDSTDGALVASHPYRNDVTVRFDTKSASITFINCSNKLGVITLCDDRSTVAATLTRLSESDFDWQAVKARLARFVEVDISE